LANTEHDNAASLHLFHKIRVRLKVVISRNRVACLPQNSCLYYQVIVRVTAEPQVALQLHSDGLFGQQIDQSLYILFGYMALVSYARTMENFDEFLQ
jgi:hypothetical protein